MSVYFAKCQELIKYMHDIRLAASRQGHVGWAKYDVQFRYKKRAVLHSIMRGGWFWTIGNAHSPGLESIASTALDRESYMGNMGSNHSFRNTQGPCNPREITRVEGQEWVQTTTMVIPKSGGGGICYAFNKGSCSFNLFKFRHRCTSCGMQPQPSGLL